MKNKIFPSVSFHITKPCNMACKFCYATYDNLKRVKMLTPSKGLIILKKLADAGVQKVTFAGGEPMLHPNLELFASYAKLELGMTTGIITNGSLLTEEIMHRWHDNGQIMDWLGLSIDSFRDDVNERIGRVSKNKNSMSYSEIIKLANKLDYKVKINTVLNSYNLVDILATVKILNLYDIERFKLLRALRVNGQNDENWNEIKISDNNWKAVVKSIQKKKPHLPNIRNFVFEDNDNMTASYLLVNPLGQIYENWGEENKISPSLLTHTVEECLENINLDYKAFEKRGGLYDW